MSSERLRQCDALVAILGAPNSGKTTLFNAITGRSELVANWPGATVQVKVAVVRVGGLRLCLADLPGAYSLTGTSPEEKVTVEFLRKESPDVVIVLADSTSLERSLYLPLEVLEAHPRVVVALTKIDEAERRGLRIDTGKLSRKLGVPVVLTAALRNKGIRELLEAVVEVLRRPAERRPSDEPVEPVKQLARALKELGYSDWDAQWLAKKLLEGAPWAHEELASKPGGASLLKLVEDAKRRYLEVRGKPPEVDLVDARYARASELFAECVTSAPMEVRLSLLDRLVLHPLMGPLVSLATLLTLFFAAFTLNTGFPLNVILASAGAEEAAKLVEEYSLVGLLEKCFDLAAAWLKSSIPDPLTASLVADGIVGGVGTIVAFLPLMATVFALLGALEDSGILPRLAAGVDQLLRTFRLSGKSVFPALVSLGCNVPGVVASRIVESSERTALYFSLPLIPCQARLIVILALAAAVARSPAGQALVVVLVYLIAVSAYLATAWLVMRLRRAEPEELVLEQPPIKPPSARVVWWFVWDKVKHFLVRAGTVIFAMSVIVWYLTSFGPSGAVSNPLDSYAARMGALVAPVVSAVLGVEYGKAWRIAFALLNGFVAKEVLLDALVMATPMGPGAPTAEALAWYGLSPSQWLGLLVMSVTYMPCIATLATVYAETRSVKLCMLLVLYTTALALLLGLLVRLLASPLAG